MAKQIPNYFARPVVTPAIPTPQEQQRNQQGMFGNIIDSAQAGALSAVGGIFDFVGADGIAKQFYGWSDKQYEQMSDAGREAMGRQFFEEDEDGNIKMGEGLTSLDTWLLTLANVAGQFAGTAIPGAGAAGAVARAANLGSKGRAAANVVGMGATGGAAATGQGMEQAREEVRNMPDALLADSAIFRDLYLGIDARKPDWNEEQKWDAAKEALAAQVAREVQTDPVALAANFGASAIGDPIIGRALTGARLAKNGAFRSAVRGALIEGSTEAVQAGTQQYSINQALQPIDNRDSMDGVGLAAINEGLAGAGFGGVAGGIGGVANRQPQQPAATAPQNEPTAPTAPIDPAVAAVAEQNPTLGAELNKLDQASANRQRDVEQALNRQRDLDIPTAARNAGFANSPQDVGRFGDMLTSPVQRSIAELDEMRARTVADMVAMATQDKSPTPQDRFSPIQYQFEGEVIPAARRQPAGLLEGLMVEGEQAQFLPDNRIDGEYFQGIQTEPQQPKLPQKDIIFAGDNRTAQAAQERAQELERMANRFADTARNQPARIPQKDIIFAGNETGVTVKQNGKPFMSAKEALASKTAREAKKAGNQIEAVPFADGFGWRVVAPNITEKAPNISQATDTNVGTTLSDQAAVTPSHETDTAPSNAQEAQARPAIRGKRARTYTPASNKPIDVEYRVVEADSLVTSNDFSGAVNPNYPAEMQPRNRSRQAYQMQVNNIAKNPIADKLLDSPDTDRGAPVVRNGIVESGNGRSIGLREAYRTGRGDAYKQALIARAEQLGLDPEQVANMQQPVLVRERLTELSPAELREFTVDSNQSAGVEQSPAELAKTDAAMIDDALITQLAIPEDGDVLAPMNSRFLRGFAAKLGNNELGSYMTSDGQWNKAFKDRVQNAIFAKGYDDAELLSRISESTNPESKNLLSALMSVAGKLGAIRALDADIGSSLSDAYTQAAGLLSRAKREGTTVDAINAQADMLTGHTDANIVALAESLESMIRSSKRMTALLDGIASSVLTDTRNMGQTDIFTGEPGARPNVNEVIRNAAGQQQPDNAGTPGLFDSPQNQEADRAEQPSIPQDTEPSRAESQPSQVSQQAEPTNQTLEQSGVSVSEDAESEVKPTERKATKRNEKLQDAGDSLFANKKGWFSGSGIKWSDIANENDTLRVSLVSKQKVWPKPNWETIINSAPEAEREAFTPIVHMVKQVYDSISTKPTGKTDQALQDYIEAITKTKEAAEDLLSNKEAQFNLWNKLASRAARRMASPYNIGSMATKGDMAPIFAKVFPQVAAGARFKRGDRENDLAIQLGSKAIKVMQFDASTAVNALKDIDKGWPAKQEAWQKQGYSVIETDGSPVALASTIKRKDGDIYSARVDFTRADNGKTVRVFLGSYDSYQEAKNTADKYANENSKPFALLNKRGNVVSTHNDAESATDAARSMTKRETGKTLKDEPLQAEDVRREGPERRKDGRDVSSQELMEAFGFRGVNFGNWVKANERQWFINQAYDGFYDLAETLDLPPKAISLNGMLGVAFGAQGNSGANAHFVPGFNEINLTKNTGAGALAHEWGHALDHYFGVRAGLGKLDKPFATSIEELTYRQKELVQENLDKDGGIRSVIRDAFVNISALLKEKTETMEAYTKRIRESKEKSLNSFDEFTSNFKDQLNADGKAALNDLRAGNTGEYVNLPPPKGKRKSPGAVYQKVKDVADSLPEYFADPKMVMALHREAIPVYYASEQVSNAPALRKIHTDFYSASRSTDASKGGKSYWSTNVEMFARAFESYVMDRMAEKNQINDFLVRPNKADRGKSDDTFPYPAGIERKEFNALFDTLLGAIETKESDDGNVILFSKASTKGTKPAKGVPVSVAQREADKFVASLSGAAGIKVQILPTQKDAEKLWRMSLDGDFVRGAYSDKTGTVYIIAENARNMTDLRQTIAHELFAHGGLDKVIGADKKQEFLNRLKGTRGKKEFKGLWSQIDRDYDGMSEDVKAEELFAYFVQNQPQRGPVKFWWNAFKRWLNNILANLGITSKGDPDIDLMQSMMESIMFGFQFGRQADSNAEGNMAFSKEGLADQLLSDYKAEYDNLNDDAIRQVISMDLPRAEPVVTFHLSYLDAESFTIEDKGMFGGIFTGPNGGMGGEYLHGIILDPSKIADHASFNNIDYKDRVEHYQKLDDELSDDDMYLLDSYITEERATNDIDEDVPWQVERLIGDGWKQQKIRGEIAKNAGYQAVEMNDETGVSTLVIGGNGIKTIPIADNRMAKGDLQALVYNEWKRRKALGDFSGINQDSDIRFSKDGDVTETEAFKRWFGDSKVVDEDGKPLVVYHGTNSKITTFSEDKRGSVFDDEASRSGFFFTEDIEDAEFFANKAVAKNDGEANVISSFVKIEKPFIVTDDVVSEFTEQWLDDLRDSDPSEWEFQTQTKAYQNGSGINKGLELAVADAARSRRYDGVIVDVEGGAKWFIPFKAEQIKSATDNNGDFDPTNPDIRFSKTKGQPDTRTAREKIGQAQVANQTISDRIKNTVDTIKDSSWWKAVGTRATEGIFDGLHGIKKAEEAAGITDPNKMGYVSARLATGLGDMLHALFSQGALEWKGGVTSIKKDTKGLLEVFGMLPEDNGLNNWLAWMAANRAEKLMAEGRENNLTAKDIAELKALAKGNEALFEEVRKEYNKINSATLDLAEQAGLISAEQRAGFDEEWYVPFFREMDIADPDLNDVVKAIKAPFTTKTGIVGQSANIKALIGGTQSTQDLLQNIIQRQVSMIDAAVKNNAAREVAGNLDGTGFMTREDSQEFDAAVEALGLTRNELATKHQKVRIMENGKPVYYYVHDAALLRGLMQVHDVGSKALFNKMARSAKRFLTTGVTLSPDFIIRNFIRDAAHAWMVNKDGAKLGTDTWKGLKASWQGDPNYWKLIASGAAFQGGYIHGADPEAAQQQIRRALRAKGMTTAQVDGYMASIVTSKDKLMQAFEKYRQASDKLENSNRMTVYERAIAAGKSERQALFESKDLMDYSLKGNFGLMGTLIDMLPFFNARLQGLYKLGRAAAAEGDDQLFKVLSRDLAMKGLKVAAFSTALAAMYGDDERYKQLPEWDKDAHWHFFLGEGTDGHIRIPKPFELGIVFGTFPERLFNFGAGNQSGKDAREAVGHAVFNTLALNPVPQLVMPVYEVLRNKSSFTGAPIETLADQQREKADRYDERTSDVTRALGGASALAGLSPKQVEHLVTGYTGTLGGYVLGMADFLARVMTGREKASTPAADWPIVRTLYQGGKEQRNTMYQQRFIESLEKAREAYGSYKLAIDEQDPDRAQRQFEKRAKELNARLPLERVQRRVSDINKAMRTVERDTRLSSGEKKDRLQQLQRQKNELYEQAYMRLELRNW